ncbi:MAG: hypothetical protein KatS3mg054_0615 [Chloroflexus sp.]|nr:MAG: hypothetical protein KatS3mg054_0615 [Chloroflexus sp.]
MRKIVVIISDTHCGSKLALMNPQTQLYSEDESGNLVPYTPEMTASQKYLWQIYTMAIEYTHKIAGNAPVYLIHLGDEVDGNKYPQGQVSSRLSDQVIIAADVLRPWFALNLQAIRIVIGTQAHNFGEGSSAHLLCRMLPEIAQPLYHAVVEVDGVTLDVAHHGPFPGSRNWLRGNSARFYLRDLMQTEIMAGRRPPDVVLRGHYHNPVYEYLETERFASRLYILPSWCMINDHALQSSRSPHLITHGLLLLEIEDGRIIRDHRLYHTIDIRRREKIA